MITPATAMKNNLGRYLELAIKEPIEVTKSGRRVAVLLSAEEYDRLSRLEDRYWEVAALAAATRGFLGPEATLRTLTRTGHEETAADD